MLFKHKHLLEELRGRGIKATGEILSLTTLGESASITKMFGPDEDLTKSWFTCRMVLRVVPEDRGLAPFEATVLTRIHTEKFQGGHVPVWFDPADHAKVVVDYEADVEQKMALRTEVTRLSAVSDRSSHRNEQRVGLVWTPIEGTLIPIEAIPRVGRGLTQVTDWPVPAVQQAANAAVSFVRQNAATLLPPRDGGWDAWFAGHDFRIFQPYGLVPAPEGATDASNATLAIALAVISALCGRMVRWEVAVSGILAPSGELQPVPSLRDTAHAARQAFAQRLVASVGNEHELGQVPDKIRQNIEIVFAGSLKDAMRLSLTKHPVKDFQPPS